eukprot:1153567-Pelagomonas_calceolata.AAC.2
MAAKKPLYLTNYVLHHVGQVLESCPKRPSHIVQAAIRDVARDGAKCLACKIGRECRALPFPFRECSHWPDCSLFLCVPFFP